jgi:hypothetical protein
MNNDEHELAGNDEHHQTGHQTVRAMARTKEAGK